jgi:glycosyltransferase involved in cell wall biosynthesis
VKVLMISTDHLMIDRRILQEAESLRDAGHEVEILAGFECPEPEDYVWNGIRISRFVFDWNDTRAQALLRPIKRRGGRLWAHLWKATTRALGLLTGLSSFEHFVLRQILERQFDVLHVHDLPLLPVGVAVKRRRGCKLVYDAHELYHAQSQLPARLRRRYWRRERRFIGEADVAITVNRYLADMMARDYRCRPPEVILNAARPVVKLAGSSGLRETLGLSQNTRIVLYQGWMSPERGIDVLVRAAGYFPPHVRLVLVGYGAFEQELKAISHEQGSDDGRVIFFGRVEPEQLMALTYTADLGVIPYWAVDLNNQFCSPNKLFEFVAAELPFIANDLPFLKDIIDAYGCGAVADLRDPSAAAAAILEVVDDPERLAAMRSGARQAADQLNWNIEGGKLLAIYDRLFSPAGPASRE